MSLKTDTQKVDAPVVWEIVKNLEECMAWVEDDEALLRDSEQSIEQFKFALILERK